MTEKVEINEEDVFKYVFSKEELENYKIDFIENNYAIFEKEIIQCMEMLELEKEELSENEETKLLTKIYNQNNIILLYPQKNVLFTENNKLAADSLILENKLNTYTFLDNKSEFMIRVLSKKEFTKFFVLNTKAQQNNKFKLTLFPSKLEFYGELNSGPIQTEFIPDIEKIELELLEN